MNIQEYKRIYKNRGNKFHAKTTTYNGRHYHSALEAGYAMELDWMLKAGVIKEWIPQWKIDLRINDVHICNYFVDFKVIFPDDHFEYHEVKGYETDVWKLKWKMSLAIYGKEKFVLIK